MRLLLTACAALPGLLLALAATPTSAIEADPFWGIICATPWEHPTTLAAFSDAEAKVPDVAPCGPQPAAFHELPSVGGGGDTTVKLDVGFDAHTSRLCFVNKALSEAPVIRVGVGRTLTFQLTNTLHNNPPRHSLNCAIQVFGGEGICYPRPQYQELPGPDGDYYPIEANQQHTADGTTNLHVHGLFVPPQPCSDEVLRSTIYPANWILPTTPLQPCQTAINTLTYTYALPANHPAGLYWYHTHRHGTAEQQTQMGLVGAIVVEDEGDAHRKSIGVTDEVLVVTDTPLKTCVDGPACDIAVHVPSAAVAAAASPAPGPALDPRIDEINEGGCATGAADATGGYQLWTVNLNGAPVLDSPGEQWPPDSEVLSKTMRPGQRQIFRLLNASADTFIAPRLTLSWKGVQTVQELEVFARDGVGLADATGRRHLVKYDVAANPLIVPPAGRVEFVVHAPPPGGTLYLDSTQVAPGCGGNQYPPRRLLGVTAEGARMDRGAADDSDLLIGSYGLVNYVKTLPDKASVSRTFVFSEYPRGFTYGLTRWLSGPPAVGDYDPNQVDFFITQVAASDGQARAGKVALAPFNPHLQPPQVVVHLKGQDSVTEEWLVENATVEMHAFHIHQIHFRDITRADPDPDLQPLLDTITVPPAQLVGDIATGHPGAPGWVKLRLTFTKADIGEFVFHCHILEHEDNGMMAKIQVVAD